MIKNYSVFAWRALLKNKLYSLLNIAGLAIGIASFILISQYVLDEIGFDKWIPDAENIYRVDGDIKLGGDEMNLAVSCDPMGATLKKDYPQVDQFVRLYNSNGSKLIRKGPEFINETAVMHADSTLLDIFPFQILAGDKLHPLDGKDKVIMSEKAAQKYFGSIPYENIIGKTIETDDDPKFYTVTAIMKNMPANTHFYADLFFSMANVNYDWGNFLSNNFVTFIKLQKGTDPHVFNKNFKTVIDKYLLPQAQVVVQIKSMEEFEQSGNKINYFLTPLTSIHLHSNRTAELGANGNIQYIYIFSIVAFFILLIACINFMNLATARSASRAKEVGVRKVLGIDKFNLILQFLSESVLMAFLSTILGIAMAAGLLHYFNDLAAKEYQIIDLFSKGWILAFILLPILVGILSGLYPAFYLSSFRPIAVLKGKVQSSWNKDRFRSSLVVFQFITSILLIIGSIVVFKQLNFIQNTNVGFQKDQVLILDGTSALKSNREAFKNEISSLTGVSGSTYTGYIPVNNSARNDNTFFKNAVLDINESLNMQVWKIDENYIPTLGMEMVKGRNFEKEMKTDSLGLILNEAAVKLLGFDDNPLEHKLYGGTDIDKGKVEIYNIIGVVKDFNYSSLRKKVGPLCFSFGNSRWSMGFKVKAVNTKNLIGQIETKWKLLANGAPFSYRFLDDAFDEMYRSERRIGKIALAFSILAILIACLG
ncbi:MAG: ABC transporter permease, partial [Saprospiraceae bacterium]